MKNIQNILSRAFHTFWQAFVVVFAGGMWDTLSSFHSGLGAGRSALLALVLSAAAAGLSALKTVYVQSKQN